MFLEGTKVYFWKARETPASDQQYTLCLHFLSGVFETAKAQQTLIFILRKSVNHSDKHSPTLLSSKIIYLQSSGFFQLWSQTDTTEMIWELLYFCINVIHFTNLIQCVSIYKKAKLSWIRTGSMHQFKRTGKCKRYWPDFTQYLLYICFALSK